MVLPEWMMGDPRVRHRYHRPASSGQTVPPPSWVSVAVRRALAGVGVERLWRHQAEAAEALFEGRHVALATPTASGKSLAYLLPIVAATAEGRLGFATPDGRPRLIAERRPHTALYLAPTKALAHDQLRAARELELPGWRISALDGDSDPAERRFAREFAGFVLSNPDMLHRSLLPAHQRWSGFLGSLRFVVVDEAHRYRGLFGAHVAAVLRRLRRLCQLHGADPVFVTVSGTLGSPGALTTALTGVEEVTVVEQDHSPHPALDLVFWEPTDEPHREAAALMKRLVEEEKQTLVFTTSRVQAELVADRARQGSRRPEAIASYRAGYLAEDRRRLEHDLRTGTLAGVASTNALELGVDIAGLDAVVSCGFPGTVAAFWQQMGRAGRAGRPALGVFVARPDPLDAFLCQHPELVVGAPLEATVLHPDNPHVLAAHLAAAAQESPLTARDSRFFGERTVELAQRLSSRGVLRARADGWYWTRPERAVDAIDLRSSGSHTVTIVDSATGRLIGVVDPPSADRTLHPGAVYLHQGEQWVVESLDGTAGVALCRRDAPGYFTQAQSTSDLRILQEERSRPLGAGRLSFGRVEFSSQVTGYLRRDEVTGAVWDSSPLTSPLRRFATQSVWWTLDAAALSGTDVHPGDLAGAAHAAEHAAIGLLPAFAPCDRWDIGGLSTTAHPDTGHLTVFVHDGYPGGAGFAERGFEVAIQWLTATLERVEDCDCAQGCPRCIVSPKCGSGNTPLAKAGARRLLELLLR